MVTKANIRLSITGALLLILLGALQACASDPLGPAPMDDPPPNCVWINGVLHCT